MIQSVTLADASGTDISLHDTTPTGKRGITKAGGLFGIAAPRVSTRDRPQAHGGIDETAYTAGKLIVLDGEIVSNVSQEDCFQEFDLVTAPMHDTLDTGPALLKWTRGSSGLALQRSVRINGAVEPEIADNASIINYQAQFFAEDPRAYSQTLTTVTGATLSVAGGGLTFKRTFPWLFTPSAGGTASCTNSGKRSTPLTLRVYGYCVNPQILNVTTGARIVIAGTVSPGDYLELDTYAHTVKLNGVTSRLNLLDSASTTWFDLPRNATTTLRLLAGTFDGVARVDALYRAAYS